MEPPTFRQEGENAVLGRLLAQIHPSLSAPSLITGPGDDCAVVPYNDHWDLLLKTDVVVESIHFTPDTEPERIGRKALARCISDIAAMGGIPEYALITLITHPDRPVEWAEGIYRGINALASRYNISIAGGETSSLPYAGGAINVALTGKVEHGQAILRSTGRPGDALYVSGALGGSFPSGKHLDFEPRLDLARLLMTQGPRPSAMMDLSDGLGSDLPRLAAACRCGFEVDEAAIPCSPGCSPHQAIADGEDYELLLAFSPEAAASLPSSWGLFPIGRLSSDRGTSLAQGWQHFCS